MSMSITSVKIIKLVCMAVAGENYKVSHHFFWATVKLHHTHQKGIAKNIANIFVNLFFDSIVEHLANHMEATVIDIPNAYLAGYVRQIKAG